MAKAPWQHWVHPGRQASHGPARRAASVRAASTICTSSESRAGSGIDPEYRRTRGVAVLRAGGVSALP